MNFIIWAKRPYPLLVMLSALEATVRDLRKWFPQSAISRGGNYWENGIGSYFYVQEELERTVDVLCKRAVENPDWAYAIFEKIIEEAKRNREFSEIAQFRKPQDYDTETLKRVLEEFRVGWRDMYAYATINPIIGYTDDNAIYARMNSILAEKTRSAPEKLADYLLVLTRSKKFLANNAQELEVLRLALKARQAGLKTREEIETQLSRELNSLVKKFGWLSFDLCDSLSWNTQHYASLVLEKLSFNIERDIEFLEDYEQNVSTAFERACSELSLSHDERKIFELVSEIGYSKWARQHEFTRAWLNAKRVQDELGTRCGLTTLESKYVLASEFDESKKAELKKLARERFANMLVVVDEQNTVIISGESARREFEKMRFASQEIPAVRELKGTPAFAGKVRGRVAIVFNVADSAKLRQGDILVSNSTYPDLAPVMKRAAAIVTDEGGITCHAAIVSRELGVPCVIGTRIATKVLKDGDLVEVDATKGIVRKIE